MANKSKSSSSLLRLDLLEVKFFENTPRYNKTTQLLGAKHNQKLLKKLPATKQDADTEINSIKAQIFELKYFGSHRKIAKELKKITKADVHRFSKSSDKAKLLQFLQDDTMMEKLITTKLIKLIQSTILLNKDLKMNPPSYIPDNIRPIITDKSHPSNPSKFFIDHCQNDKDINSYVSNLWNNKSMKKACEEVEWAFRLVRGNLSKSEKDNRRKALGKAVNEAEEDDSEEEEGEESEEETDQSEATDDESEEEGDHKNGKGVDKKVKAANMDQSLANVAGSENFVFYDSVDQVDDDSEQIPDLDPNVNYNEITDEEPSEEEDDEEDEEEEEINQNETKNKKRKATDLEDDDFFAGSDEDEEDPADSMEAKYNLPQLTAGYYSGGSDDEEDNYNFDDDKVVKQATSQRKNRRGQRARQKIWEKKFGSKAKHKQKEAAAISDDRERRRVEYEERVRKREEKAKPARENAPSGSNIEPLGQRKSQSQPSQPPKPQAEHPSWQAKKMAEQKLTNVKFTGKKIKFD